MSEYLVYKMLHEKLPEILACDWLDVVVCRICIFETKLGLGSSHPEDKFGAVERFSNTNLCEFKFL